MTATTTTTMARSVLSSALRGHKKCCNNIATTINIKNNNATTRCFSGIDKIAEDKIAAWVRQGGPQNLKTKGEQLKGGDRHQDLAKTLGLGNDFIHGKILADNNFKPVSIQRRLELDKAWDVTREEIRAAYDEYCASSSSSVSEFMESPEGRIFETKMKELNAMAKKVNDAIIDDSMRFNGRAPVRHARSFKFEERVREAIEEQD